MAERRRALVAGGSIGGLTTALLLSDLGWDVDVYERSSEALQSRGAGIVVLPITERYLTEVADVSSLASGPDGRVSLTLTWWVYLDATGRVLSADADYFRFASWNSIYRALLEAFDAGRYHLRSEMVGFEQTPESVTLHLADGRRPEGDLLVCADGLASTARRILLPGVEPVYADYVAWRGTCAEVDIGSTALRDVQDSMLYQILDDGHILVYAIPSPEGSTSLGDRLLNFVWYRNYPAPDAFQSIMTDVTRQVRPATVPPGWVDPDHLADLRERAGRELAPTLAEIVAKTKEPFVQAIYDLESPRMAFGRVCLLGDAAFGLRPHIAAGQAKACADAWALHDALSAADGDIETALAAWEPGQLELGRSAVERSQRMGQRSQFQGTMVPGDPEWKFGLEGPGR